MQWRARAGQSEAPVRLLGSERSVKLCVFETGRRRRRRRRQVRQLQDSITLSNRCWVTTETLCDVLCFSFVLLHRSPLLPRSLSLPLTPSCLYCWLSSSVRCYGDALGHSAGSFCRRSAGVRSWTGGTRQLITLFTCRAASVSCSSTYQNPAPCPVTFNPSALPTGRIRGHCFGLAALTGDITGSWVKFHQPQMGVIGVYVFTSVSEWETSRRSSETELCPVNTTLQQGERNVPHLHLLLTRREMNEEAEEAQLPEQEEVPCEGEVQQEQDKVQEEVQQEEEMQQKQDKMQQSEVVKEDEENVEVQRSEQELREEEQQVEELQQTEEEEEAQTEEMLQTEQQQTEQVQEFEVQLQQTEEVQQQIEEVQQIQEVQDFVDAAEQNPNNQVLIRLRGMWVNTVSWLVMSCWCWWNVSVNDEDPSLLLLNPPDDHGDGINVVARLPWWCWHGLKMNDRKSVGVIHYWTWERGVCVCVCVCVCEDPSVCQMFTSVANKPTSQQETHLSEFEATAAESKKRKAAGLFVLVHCCHGNDRALRCSKDRQIRSERERERERRRQGMRRRNRQSRCLRPAAHQEIKVPRRRLTPHSNVWGCKLELVSLAQRLETEGNS